MVVLKILSVAALSVAALAFVIYLAWSALPREPLDY
jgi:hypothetical protein